MNLATDIRTIIWKEFTEFVRQRATLVSIGFFIGVFGIFLPIQRGTAWTGSSAVFFNAVALPLMLVLGIVADSFAGERERHSLESLLATRLSDRAILFGKFTAVVAYAWLLTLASLAVGLVTVNLLHPGGGPHIYEARLGIGSVVFSALSAGLSASAGVMVSLRAPTVRQAAQTLSIGMTAVFLGIVALIATLPDGARQSISRALDDIGLNRLMVLVAIALLVVEGLLLAIATLRFKRTRLILD